MAIFEFEDIEKNIEKTIRDATEGLSELINSVGGAISDAKQKVDQGNVVSHSNTMRHTESGTYKNQKFKPPQLYKRTSGEETGGTIQSVIGAVFLGGGLLTTAISVLITLFGSGAIGGILFGALFLFGGLALLIGGLKRLSRIKKFKKYLSALGEKTYVTIQELMAKTGKSEKQVEEELTDLIANRYFMQGHLDTARDYFITADETFKNYEAVLRSQEKLSEAEEERYQVLREAGLSEEGIRLVLQGEEYLKRIQRLNAEIPDPPMTEKLQTMETKIKEILYAVRKNPSRANELRKLMNYYLPTTEKLILSFRELEKRPKTESATETKQKIVSTLDTMNAAFDKILTKLFRDENWDVETDITVLNQMLEMEGLKEQRNELKLK